MEGWAGSLLPDTFAAGPFQASPSFSPTPRKNQPRRRKYECLVTSSLARTLECALTQNVMLTPLECAVTKKQGRRGILRNPKPTGFSRGKGPRMARNCPGSADGSGNRKESESA